jgi:hypothetical protein
MTVATRIQELGQRGLRLIPEGDILRYRGPAAVVTPEVTKWIADEKAEIIATLRQSDNVGAGRPSPENACRPITERMKESRELHGELNHLYNTRAAILEAVAGFSKVEAERMAMSEVRATETYRRWLALG